MVLVLLSPSKTLDFDSRRAGLKTTVPHFQARAAGIAAVLEKRSAPQLQKLMGISSKLAQLNADRFAQFDSQDQAPAITAYQGDVYQGLNAADLSDADLAWSQNHLGILSGLYGVLRPLDRIRPYRLEMGVKLAVGAHKDLYAYWGGDITAHLNKLIGKNKTTAVVGCASKEYLDAVQTEKLTAPFINCEFREMKNGKAVIVALFAKRARGMMARFVIAHKITAPAALKKFDSAGYRFDKNLSDATRFVFVR